MKKGCLIGVCIFVMLLLVGCGNIFTSNEKIYIENEIDNVKEEIRKELNQKEDMLSENQSMLKQIIVKKSFSKSDNFEPYKIINLYKDLNNRYKVTTVNGVVIAGRGNRNLEHIYGENTFIGKNFFNVGDNGFLINNSSYKDASKVLSEIGVPLSEKEIYKMISDLISGEDNPPHSEWLKRNATSESDGVIFELDIKNEEVKISW
ncbi:hypothetical protein [Virgibacillus sp. DJP39]|uniref:hypothetical protein n=1 Tax=Virgibacillus sp. DJP39 TaxID=3409790 RepID=UPI003BB4E42E